MINLKGITQRTEEWHRIKWGKIGGTLSKGLFVKSDTLLIDILSQRCEEYIHEETFESDAMRRGNELEPFAREYLESYTGLVFQETGWMQSEENRLLGMSPDGLTEDETIQCEIKCLGRMKHYDTILKDEVPSDHRHQCLHAFTVNPKLEKLYYIAFRPEAPKPFIKMYTLDSMLDLGETYKNEIPQIGVKGQPIKSKWETLPLLKTVREYAKESLELADALLIQVNEKEQSITF
tara:strand:+ start:2169 stop:2873 length:705 start_codon:yes stop_codon:yes gene_type:complete